MVVFWHSDKPLYQKETAERICAIFTELTKDASHPDKAKQWFEAFIYIFNLHWDKVDNYRIDKYLMFVRLQFHEVLAHLKTTSYPASTMDWLKGILKKLLMEESVISKGIPLQVCDIFLHELNKADSSDISYKNLSSLLEPFLFALGHSTNKIITQRIIEKVFTPLLENNVTHHNDQ